MFYSIIDSNNKPYAEMDKIIKKIVNEIKKIAKLLS